MRGLEALRLVFRMKRNKALFSAMWKTNTYRGLKDFGAVALVLSDSA